MPVTVTATEQGGATASLILLSPSSLIVSPAFVLIDETNLQDVQLTVTALGGNTLTGWTLEASADGLEGTITPGGRRRTCIRTAIRTGTHWPPRQLHQTGAPPGP
jgi:hypothetical protein